MGDSWNKVMGKHRSHGFWYNTNGLQDQYYCHYGTIAGGKNPWNIEPGRPDVGYTATVLAACNPK